MTEPSLDLVPNLIRSRRRSQLRLLQNDSDLFDRKLLPLHDKPSFLLESILSQTSLPRWTDLCRARHESRARGVYAAWWAGLNRRFRVRT